MKTAAFFLFGLVVVAFVQADFSDRAKTCITEIGSDEDTIKTLVLTKDGVADEHNETVKKFLGCCYKHHISDNHELIVDDKLMDYVTSIFTRILGGRHKIAELVAKDTVKHCEDKKGDTKEETAVKVSNCLMKRVHELRDEGQ